MNRCATFVGTIFSTILVLSSLAACLEPSRKPFYEGIDLQTRIDSQQRRIDQGISSGELTRAEADVLQDNLNWIKQEYSKARDDGRVSGEEWNRIEGSLDQNSRMITDQSNNPVRAIYPPSYQSPRSMSIDERIGNQQHRIDMGIASGELTLKEAEVIQENLNWIKNRYTRYRADGTLTWQEQRELEDYLDTNGQMIFNKKHNPVRRLY